MLTVVTDCTRESLPLVADTSLSGLRVARELERIIEGRGTPKMIVSDNGSEFTSNAILAAKRSFREMLKDERNRCSDPTLLAAA